jgi:putative ABC transport system ATP-binding protein
MHVLQLAEVRKSYAGPASEKHTVIDIPAFTLGAEAQVALRGASGSGKTTLLHLIAGILLPDSGRVVVDGKAINELSEPRRDRLRASAVGYIFQTFNLLQGYTCLENVLLAMAFGSRPDPELAAALLERMGLSGRLRHYPRQLSSGQQQRVAVARALANRPKIVLADEPTGNLDARNASAALELMREACKDTHAALLLVSHAPEVLARFETVVDLQAINRARALPEATQ